MSYEQALSIWQSYLEDGYKTACDFFGKGNVDYVLEWIDSKEAFN